MVETGTVVTIAAGNNGDQGPFFGSNGAAGEKVLAVASVEASVLPAPPFQATFSLNGASNTSKIAYLPGFDYFPPDLKGWEIKVFSLDTTDRSVGCSPLPATTEDLSKYVVLLPKSKDCEYSEQQANIEKYGAKYVMFFNDESPMEDPWSWDWDSLYGLTEERAGIAMIETIKAGGKVTFDFSLNPETNYVGIQNAAGGVANYFTSLGGTYDLQVKPDIAGPGGDIFSTYPPDAYAVMSGTSMATPYIAGVAALYVGKYGGKKVHGANFAKDLAMRIIASGGALKWSDGVSDTDYGFWAPVPQVGNGLVNAVKVLNYDTQLSWAKFSLNDTHHFSRYQKVDITNTGKDTVTYKFSVQDAGGFEALYPYDPVDNPMSPVRDGPGWDIFTPSKMVPKVKFPSGTFKLAPGQSKTAEFIFNYPDGLNEMNMPIYSGKILITGSNGEELSVPYFGVGSNIEHNMNPMFYEGFPQSVSTWDWIPIDEKP
jgi:hypothetical protein